ncbi:hypothetical protein HMPREF3038_03315 [Akkermansia sp. KLE1797]|nr:hypothetical protein HMPREF3038_03315 [Akkermansia sp. KLE1797]KXU55160.1 hypothetical protein HMPREF3039_00622 [Akkermansia sp. KLE1798]KZA03828.1 hypothetical protein HMPREF1326_02480 [Akkermansia sp. KLE1605]
MIPSDSGKSTSPRNHSLYPIHEMPQSICSYDKALYKHRFKSENILK